jgi:hypothetical protein
MTRRSALDLRANRRVIALYLSLRGLVAAVGVVGLSAG